MIDNESILSGGEYTFCYGDEENVLCLHSNIWRPLISELPSEMVYESNRS